MKTGVQQWLLLMPAQPFGLLAESSPLAAMVLETHVGVLGQMMPLRDQLCQPNLASHWMSLWIPL